MPGTRSLESDILQRSTRHPQQTPAMASRQEKDSLFQDVFRYVEDAYQTDGREAAWYLPYGHIFSDAFRRRSRVLKRLAFGAQQEFCMDSEIAQNDPVSQITRRMLLFLSSIRLLFTAFYTRMGDPIWKHWQRVS